MMKKLYLQNYFLGAVAVVGGMTVAAPGLGQGTGLRLYKSFPMTRSDKSSTADAKPSAVEPKSASPALALKRARELKKSGDYPRAIEVLDEAIKEFPASQDLYVEHAELCIHERRLNDVLLDSDNALAKGAPNAVIYRLEAKANFMLHNYAICIKALENVAKHGTLTAEDYFTRANCYSSLGNSKAVLENIALGLKQDPKNADAYYLRAKTYKSLNQNGLASADFAKAMSLQK
jgi:tetratricopeptide (TPR) repeat protein